MSAGTGVKASPEVLAETHRKLSLEYTRFGTDELDWDWGCDLQEETRSVLREEYARRGIAPGRTRGRRRQ